MRRQGKRTGTTKGVPSDHAYLRIQPPPFPPTNTYTEGPPFLSCVRKQCTGYLLFMNRIAAVSHVFSLFAEPTGFYACPTLALSMKLSYRF